MDPQTYADAFEGKESVLITKLDISHGLLPQLKDRKILKQQHVEAINEERNDYKKVEKLLDILKRRDDSTFDSFCEALTADDQYNIVEILSSQPAKFQALARYKCIQHKAELCEIIEPDYGLMDELYRNEIITSEQFEIGSKDKCVQHCVSYLLQAVLHILETINDQQFLSALHEYKQSHVVNFITKDGKFEPEFGDDRPLNEQQRRRFLHHRKLIEEMDSINELLQTDLLKYQVISHRQHQDIMAKKTQTKSNERLLRILKRRSLAHVKIFITCLEQTGQGAIIEQLRQAGAVVCIKTTISEPQLPLENQREIENEAVNSFDELSKWRKACKLIADMKQDNNDGHELLFLGVKASIAWYIMCYTPTSLESLKFLYNEGKLQNTLETIFNCLCDGDVEMKLNVEWSNEDYEDCKKCFNETSGMPFGPYDLSDCEDNGDDIVAVVDDDDDDGDDADDAYCDHEKMQTEDFESDASFTEAFTGKRADLIDAIDADSVNFWLKLEDKDVLTSEQINECKCTQQEPGVRRIARMMELLDKRPNSLFPKFCEALIESQQEHVVTAYFGEHYKPCSASDQSVALQSDAFKKLLSDLSDMIEPDTFMNHLRYKDIITDKDVEDVDDERKTYAKVDKLLKILGQKIESDEVLQALCDAGQTHVAMYIQRKEVIGNTFSDSLRPLSKQHRIRLSHPHLLDHLHADSALLTELVAYECISRRQKQHVENGENDRDRSERLIDIITRQSIAVYKNFVACLVRVKLDRAAEICSDNGVLVELHVNINRPASASLEQQEQTITHRFNSEFLNSDIHNSIRDGGGGGFWSWPRRLFHRGINLFRFKQHPYK